MSQAEETLLPDDPRFRRRILIRVLIVLAYVIVVVLAYFAMPAGEFTFSDSSVAVVLAVIALVLLVLLYIHGLRRVSASGEPILRSVSLLATLFVTFLVVFSYIYLSLQTQNPGQLPGLVTHLDGLYFTVTMITTVGFGDISPAEQAARGVATVQMLFNLVFLGFAVQAAVKVGRESRRRRDRDLLEEVAGGTVSND